MTDASPVGTLYSLDAVEVITSTSGFPDHSDFDSLDEKDLEKNNQLAFDVAEKEFGISPCMTGKEMSSVVEPDKLSMVMYLSQFYEMFKDTVPPGGEIVVLQSRLRRRLRKLFKSLLFCSDYFFISWLSF